MNIGFSNVKQKGHGAIGRIDVQELRGVGGGETIIRICNIEKNLYFSTKEEIEIIIK